MRKLFKKSLAVIMVVVMTLTAAPLSGFVGMQLPEFSGVKNIAASVSDFFSGLSVKAEAAETYSGTCGDNLTWSLDTETGVLKISGTGAMKTVAWSSYSSEIRSVTIDYGVSKILNWSFDDCANLVDIIIPDSVTNIGNGAFSGCVSLEKIKIPNNVTNIGNNTFFGCESLKEIEIPNSVISIGDNAFTNCCSLERIEIPNSVISIGDNAFTNCCSLERIEIPNSVTNIGEDAFSGCESLKEIEIPNSVTNIGEYAFSGCDSLEKIEIPNSVTNIGNRAFFRCESLEKIEIPNSVISIGAWAFEECRNLKEITLPDSLTEISEGMFSICNSLEKINLPDSVTKIGEYAFESCRALTEIAIPINVKSIEQEAFSYCTGLKEVTFGDNKVFNTVGSAAFRKCESLQSISLPESTKRIEEYAFDCCYNLSSVYLGKIEYLGHCVFYEDDLLNFVFIPNTLIEAEYYYNSFTEASSDIELNGGFTNYYCTPFYGSNVKTVIFEDGIKTIPAYTCAYSSIKNVVIPDCLITIDKYAFYRSDLTNIILTDKIETIGARAFDSSRFNYITLPQSLKTIGVGAFGDSELKSIVVPDSVTEIGTSAFSNSAKSVKIGTGLKKLYNIIGGYSFVGGSVIIVPVEVLSFSENVSEIDAGMKSAIVNDIYYNGTETQWNETKITLDDELEYQKMKEAYNFSDDYLTLGYFKLNHQDVYDSTTVHYKSEEPHFHIFEDECIQQLGCTQNGITVLTCSCGETYTQTIPATGHVIDEYRETVKTGCETEGKSERKCMMCHIVLDSKTKEATGHDYKITSRPAGCTEPGEVSYACSNCGDNFKQTVAAVGHTAGEWETIKQPSCTQTGEKIQKCTNCSEIINRQTIEKAEHTSNSSYETTKAATCTQSGMAVKKCVTCKEVLDTKEIPATGHTAGSWVTTKEPTCTAEGTKVKKCKKCGAEVETQAIATTEHIAGNWQIITMPTATDEGVKIKKCTGCGKEMFRETIPMGEMDVKIPSPSKNTVKFGDTLVLTLGETELPEGMTIAWFVEGAGVATWVSEDGLECRVTSIANGNATIYAKLVDEEENIITNADGEEIFDEITLTSKAGFWQRFISFFKNLFGINRVIY